MQYIKLKEELSHYTVFSLKDIKKNDKLFYRSRLNDWQNKGYIKKIRRGYYMFSDQVLNESVLCLIANKIYSPSYISFEMALSNYNLIPESVYGITSATTNKTNSFKTLIGEFIYKHLKPELMFGYKIESINGVKFKIADVEKTILDFFYINTSLTTREDFSELRINKEEFMAKVDQEKFQEYLDLFKNKSLEKRIKVFLKFINNADS
ncbi:MAG: hypothetical protein NT091_04270 [Candidatus Falkowbacteria bacterium]|nr:hypothetical protein [Candidatus Falkowbacteria bacterium]